MLKIVAVFVLVAFLCPSDVQCTTKEVVRARRLFHRPCKNWSGVSEEALALLKNGKFLEDEALKDYIGCSWVYVLTLLMSMHVDVEDTYASMPQQDPTKDILVANNCDTIGGADIAEVMFRQLKCQYQTDPNRFLPALIFGN